jgi:topoisomerase-4 subunit A
MTTDLLTPETAAAPEGDHLGAYAQRAYLEYALSVVKGRALPDVCDGQKPVQRRILYSMDRMGLSYSGPNNNTAAKPVKSTATRRRTTHWCAWRRTFRSATR